MSWELKKTRISVLAVCPRFAPISAPDAHRLRLLIPHAKDAGWSVTVLAVHPQSTDESRDAWLEEGLPKDLEIHRVNAWRLGVWGTRGLAQRAVWGLWRRGSALLSTGRFDLVFFSTTEFAVHALGPLWERRFGVPFCMDLQDPWVTDYYRNRPRIRPPGGRLKYRLASMVHSKLESYTIPECSGFLSVSGDYLSDLSARYGSKMSGRPCLVRAFPAAPEEWARIARKDARVNPQSARKTWRYVGAAGGYMLRSIEAFVQAWRDSIQSGSFTTDCVAFEAYGTSYAGGDAASKVIEPMVHGTVLEQAVKERPGRLLYSDALQMLATSDALIVFGSDDPAYTPSKIYPYLLARVPVLAVLHARSPAAKLLSDVGGAICVTFDESTSNENLARAIKTAWFENRGFDTLVKLDHDALQPFTSRFQATEVGAWFRDVLSHSSKQTGAAGGALS